MNIQEAKEQIKQTIQIYLKKDDFGAYRIPTQRQRPIFLLGAPGIGKTAIMAQIAAEMEIGLVSYSMTHHTRQSALGLPYISQKDYGGETYAVSEYTMSEIIASVYDTIEASGKKEGILFLDEINCVSETLAPAILQFLQYKVFGRHQVPEGWVVVTAGNPPAYNKSVREMDLATLDRLKVLVVEEDYRPWRLYAKEKGIHGAITNYLDLKKKDFYRIETTVEGKAYVTARGWEDLSEALILYEEEGLKIDETLIFQYLHHEQVAKSFASYYDLYCQYQDIYNVEDILNGEATEEMRDRLKGARFDEQLSLTGLLINALYEKAQAYQGQAEQLESLLGLLKPLQAPLAACGDSASVALLLEEAMAKVQEERQKAFQSGGLSRERHQIFLANLHFLEAMHHFVQAEDATGERTFSEMQGRFAAQVETWEALGERAAKQIEAGISFVETTFGEGEIFLIFLTELATHGNLARLIAEKEVAGYFAHQHRLQHLGKGHELQKKAQNHFAKAWS